MSTTYFILIGAIALVGFLVQNRLKSKFHQYGQVGLAMVDAEVTRQAAMISYLNDFELMKWMSLAAVPLVFLMRRSPTYGRA